VIPNLMPFQALESEATSASSVEAKPQYVTIVGNPHPNKNVIEGVQLFMRLRSLHPGLELHVIGPGLNPGSALDPRETGIKFLGEVTWGDLRADLRDSRVLVHLSKSEGCSVIGMESMELGLPVAFNADTDSMRWLTGKAGIPVSGADDPDSVARVSALLAKSILRDSYSETARLEARRFHPDILIPQWLDIYSNLAFGIRGWGAKSW
jgi:glycosyltransferase involved in cell wall biosynthesis